MTRVNPFVPEVNVSILNEFKAFIQRGNVLDLAVGVVIGAAFGKIVTSFVGDLLMPVIGLLLGKTDFSNFFLALDGKSYETLAAARTAGAPVLAYGAFVNIVIEFLIVAAAVFLLVKAVSRIMPAPPAAPETTRECPECTLAIAKAASRCPHCTSQVAPLAA